MATLGNTDADIVQQDKFNEFMIAQGAFIRDKEGQLLVNKDYQYSFEALLLEFKKL